MNNGWSDYNNDTVYHDYAIYNDSDTCIKVPDSAICDDRNDSDTCIKVPDSAICDDRNDCRGGRVFDG
jgi:hypothetical protein